MDSEEEKECQMSPEIQEEIQKKEEEKEEKEEDEERGDVMGQTEDTEEWNGFLGRTRRVEELVVNWKPGDPVTPQYVLTLAGYTPVYLCSPEDNIYNISFSRFKIRDLEGGSIILDLKRHCPTVEEMISHPFETRSDSFYFANNKLIMHHKAEYSFSNKHSI